MPVATISTSKLPGHVANGQTRYEYKYTDSDGNRKTVEYDSVVIKAGSTTPVTLGTLLARIYEIAQMTPSTRSACRARRSSSVPSNRWPGGHRKELVMMSTVGLFVSLEAKPGKEREVADFLQSGLSIVQDEPATLTWYAVRIGPTTFGIFDTFPDDAGRQAHLAGRVAAALKARAEELFARPPVIERIDILAEKIDADATAAAVVAAGK